MNDRRENKLSRNLKVKTYFNTNLATLSPGAPALSGHVTEYNDKTAQCQVYAAEMDEDITGVGEQKQAHRVTMRDLAVAVSGALHSYYLSIKDLENAKKVYLTKSEVDNARDTAAHYECDRILKKGQEMSVEIEPYGVTAAMLTDLETAVNAFHGYISRTTEERDEKKAAGEMFDVEMKASDAILRIIDGIMLTQKDAFPMLYLQYISARSIDDMTGGGSPGVPDFEFTVAPGSFHTGVNLPYNADRRFKAKNLSVEPINWSLSTAEASFSNPPTVLGAGDTSNLLSVTLAPDGDFLIFENTSPIAIDIELTVEEP